MSARNTSGDSLHRVQTVIPRAPYSGNRLFLGLLHRAIMPMRVLYSMVLLSPWASVGGLVWQPQDFANALRKATPLTVR